MWPFFHDSWTKSALTFIRGNQLKGKSRNLNNNSTPFFRLSIVSPTRDKPIRMRLLLVKVMRSSAVQLNGKCIRPARTIAEESEESKLKLTRSLSPLQEHGTAEPSLPAGAAPPPPRPRLRDVPPPLPLHHGLPRPRQSRRLPALRVRKPPRRSRHGRVRWAWEGR